MAEYAILKDGALVKFVVRDEAPEIAAHKGYSALPVVRETLDTSTQKYRNTVEVVTIEPTRYLIQTQITDKSQAEIDAIIAEEQENSAQSIEVDNSIAKALAYALFEVVNDVRVLKGQGTITPTQFKAYLKSKM